jgi:hypothetical protein
MDLLCVFPPEKIRVFKAKKERQKAADMSHKRSIHEWFESSSDEENKGHLKKKDVDKSQKKQKRSIREWLVASSDEENECR